MKFNKLFRDFLKTFQNLPYHTSKYTHLYREVHENVFDDILSLNFWKLPNDSTCYKFSFEAIFQIDNGLFQAAFWLGIRTLLSKVLIKYFSNIHSKLSRLKKLVKTKLLNIQSI